MGMRIAGLAIFLVVCVCALETLARFGKNRIRFSFSDDRPVKDSGGIRDDAAEQAWVHCRKELQDRDNVNKGYPVYIPPEVTGDPKTSLLMKQDIYGVSDGQSSSVKQAILSYLRENWYHFRLRSQEASSWLCFSCWFGSRSRSASYSRRKLASDTDQFIAFAPNFAPSPKPAPVTYVLPPAPTPVSYVPAPTSSQLRSFNSPAEAPGKPTSKQTTKSPGVSPPGRGVPSHSPKGHNDILMEIIAACVSTSVLTFILVALLFFCCFRGNSNRVGPRDGQRDERPLLHLIDVSAGASENSPSLENPRKNQFSGSSEKNYVVTSLSGKVNTHEASLADTPLDGLPPLKPPEAPPPPPAPPRPPPPPPSRPQAPTPPPKGARAPPAPPKGIAAGKRGDGSELDSETGASKAKLKPFFWDKVMANPNQAMVWHEISAGSFQFNEEMIESLFGYNDGGKNKNDQKKDPSRETSPQYIEIIDTRKAQNLSILLRALNVTTEEVVDAIQEGNELPVELLQTLLKMAPTTDEELKLRLYSGDLSQLRPAERFLKVLVDIPFAFKRIELLIFMISLQEEVSGLKESFATLEVACKKLRSSRLFLKLLEAVLKTGNRMNDGTYRGGAQAFRLDTLLKLSDVKGTDGKTTLLHFVVQEIIRSEGVRALRSQKSNRSFSSVKTDDLVVDSSPESAEHYPSLGLQAISGLSTELEDVKKAAIIDADGIAATLSKLNNSLAKAREFLNDINEEGDFEQALKGFIERADADSKFLFEEEERIMELVKNTADYFHGKAGRNEGLRLFVIVRDFLIMVDKVCKEVKGTMMAKPAKTAGKKEATTASLSQANKQPLDNKQPYQDIRQRLFPAIADQGVDSSDSSEEEEENYSSDSSSP